MKLFDHQQTAVTQLRETLRKDRAARAIIAAPCAFGKTVLAAYLCKAYQDAGKRALFICDRVKLVQQTINAFESFGIDFGVIQAHHELFDLRKPVQIASIQSLENFHTWPHADIVIIDECHVLRESVKLMMETWNAIPFVGLSATPYSKGLGASYKHLLVPTTPRELLGKGYLTPVRYFGGRTPDLKGVRTKQLVTGGTDYTEKGLRTAIEKDDLLAGDIVQNWLKHANGKMTIAFSPSIKHSKHMVELFNSHGIPAIHIDGSYKDQDRQDIFEAHRNGEFLILSCSQLLNTGYDEPAIECLIDCYPTKSLIQFIQRAGRIMRVFLGKIGAIYLDHAGNVARHGFAEDAIPESLDDGEKQYNERSLTKEKKEPKIKDCPQCDGKFTGIRCVCGYEIPIKEKILTDNQELQEIHSADSKTWNKKAAKEEKEKFYGQLLRYASQKGYKPGWANNVYRERAGVWPNKIRPVMCEPTDDFKNYIKHRAIKYRARA